MRTPDYASELDRELDRLFRKIDKLLCWWDYPETDWRAVLCTTVAVAVVACWWIYSTRRIVQNQ